MSSPLQTKDLVERAVSGLHASVFEVVRRVAPPPRAVLDLGAGTGAWAARLGAAGYQVTAIECETSTFAAPGVELVNADLNQSFADNLGDRDYQLITCLEVIEHMENPRNLLRQCSRLLRSDGVLVITTPNIESVPARLRFFATGELSMFGRDPTRNEASHITPIHTLMFERMIADTGFALKAHEFNASFPIGTRPLNRMLSKLASLVVRGVQGGDCHIFVLLPRVQL